MGVPGLNTKRLCFMLIFQCKDGMMNTETFLTILKSSDNTEELQAIKLMVDTDVTRLRSKDTGGEDGMCLLTNSITLILGEFRII